jgi:hypothetical protein
MHLEDIAKHLPVLFMALLVSILFVQSGLDKVLDWKGNVDWLNGHFSKTFLGGMVPMMLATITLMELATGALHYHADILGVAPWSRNYYSSIFRPANCQRLCRRCRPGAVFPAPHFPDVSHRSVSEGLTTS